MVIQKKNLRNTPKVEGKRGETRKTRKQNTVVKNTIDTQTKVFWEGIFEQSMESRIQFDQNILTEKITGRFTTKKEVANSLKINQQIPCEFNKNSDSLPGK